MRKTIFMVLIPVLGLSCVTFAREGEWTKKADMPTARVLATSSAVNGKIYAIGGIRGDDYFTTVEEYDPATDTWTEKADMPTARSSLSASAVNGKIYVIGGNRQAEHFRTVEEYDPIKDTWRKRADMPTGRRGLSTSVVNGKIYAIGGYHRGGTGLGELLVAEYDPDTNTWDTKADMPTGRANLSTSAVNGKIYAIGGNLGVTEFSIVEEYNPATDTWTRKADMPTARMWLSTSVVDGKIYAIGGTGDDNSQYLSTIEVYDPATDTWTVITDMMPTGRFGHSASVVDGRIYAVGGQPDRYPAVTGATEEYQPIPWPFARCPNPATFTLHPDTWVTLSWESGDFAVSHNVYLGESFEDVNEGLGNTFLGNQVSDFLSAGFPGFPYPDGLVRGKTYYWRIDEVNDAESEKPWKGSIWSFTIQPRTAFNPVPANGEKFVDWDVELIWTGGLEAVFHKVYFGDNFNDVNNATGNIQQVKTTFNPGPLKSGKTYYWRVDEYEGGRGGGVHKGEIWSFTTEGAAGNPDPSNDITSVEMNPTLRWAPADNTTAHHVYFGTNKETVRNADSSSPEYKGTHMLGVDSYYPGILSPNTTYYWRVDEVNDAHTDSPWTGGLWSFTTGDFFLIDDFEDYDVENKIWWTWKDGVGYADHPTAPPYTGNGTGSMVGDEREASTVGDFRIHTGRYSMPFWFDNNQVGLVNYSEATMELTSPHDWTRHGVDTLSIWCISDWDWINKVSANDAEPMYVVLNDSAVIYHDAPDITQVFSWIEWRINLQEFVDLGVDLTNIQMIGLGFGNKDNPQPGGSGLMSFDDIRLVKSP